MVVGFHWPVPWHRHFLEHQAQFPLAAITYPEGRVAGLGKRLPRRAFLLPQRVVGVAAGLDEGEELAVGDQVAAGLEGGHVGHVSAEFVVPSVDQRFAALAAETQAGRRDVDQRVGRRGIAFAAWRPGWMRLHVLPVVLADQHRRGFEMDALVLDAHQDGPERIFPADWQAQWMGADDAIHDRPYLAAIGADFGDARPVVAGVVEIIPAHLIDPDREHRFQSWIETLGDQAGEQELIDEEGGRVAEVEDQWVTQADGFAEVGIVPHQDLEQRFVAVEGCVKIVQQFATAGLDIGAGQLGRSGEELRHRRYGHDGVSQTVREDPPLIKPAGADRRPSRGQRHRTAGSRPGARQRSPRG
ncbi:hypothetical protein SDC9_95019 [bioreactor metagenome]|uniref:Uncharacterized protein n=1 Tax=bioreactor metagenome TaxID=1076179 RepID=A0A645A528_9ZZZZ